MMGGPFILAAIVGLSMLMSTKEQRAQARAWWRPVGRRMLPFVLIGWAGILFSVIYYWSGDR